MSGPATLVALRARVTTMRDEWRGLRVRVGRLEESVAENTGLRHDLEAQVARLGEHVVDLAEQRRRTDR